ncbi:MAG TPA: SDR family NAD(P)-dependent oxidoreductase [Thermoplasmata archaeon]|nr:SDR family NAD(P)-dependent oxidoreductase [Thermoplasmata archaeon]
MRAFITGGTGLIGRPLVAALLARGWEVSVLTRDPTRARDLEARGARIVCGDVTRRTFQAAMAHADVVFHTAGWIELGVTNVARMFEVNVAGTANILSMARQENVGRIVFTSTAGVFAPTPLNPPATESAPIRLALNDPYVRSKVQAHELAVKEMRSGLPVTIILPAAVFGPYDTGQLGRSLALLVRGRLPRLPNGFGTNTWTHAADIAEGVILAATRGTPGELYLLADRVLPVVTFYRLAAEAAGVPPPRANVPMGLARFAARFSEASARLAGRTPILSRASLDLAAVNIIADASKARTELGWNPQRLEDRIRETMAWYVDRYRDRRAPPPLKPSGASA